MLTEEESSQNNADVPVCPEHDASVWSRIWFNWIGELMEAGSEKCLEASDVWSLDKEDRSRALTSRFQEAWKLVKNFQDENVNVKKNKRNSTDHSQPLLGATNVSSDTFPNNSLSVSGSGQLRVGIGQEPKRSLKKVLKHVWSTPFWVGGCWRILSDAFTFVAPLYMAKVIKLNSERPENWKNEAVTYVFIMFFAQILTILCQSKYLQQCNRVGLQIRSTLVSELFRKCISMSRQGWAGMDMGKVNTMISGDTEALEQACQTFHSIWSAPIRMVFALYFLYNQLGYSAFIGASMLFLMLPIQKRIVTRLQGLWKRIYIHAGERTKLLREFLNSIHIIKMYTWEDPFLLKIRKVRTIELGLVKSRAIWQAVNLFLVYAGPALVAIASFGSFVSRGILSLLPLTFPFL